MADPGAGGRIHEIYKGRIVRLTTERVVLPNGHETELEIVRHPGASAVVPVTAEGEIILIRQYRHAAGGYIIEVPAGKLDSGEPPEMCAARELTEEAGVAAGRLTRLGSIVTTPGFTDEVIHLFLAEELQPAAISHESCEVISLLRRSMESCLAMIEGGEITDAKSICALFLADRRLRSRAAPPPRS
jgi:ADP-ribose pyrophosphatase